MGVLVVVVVVDSVSFVLFVVLLHAVLVEIVVVEAEIVMALPIGESENHCSNNGNELNVLVIDVVGRGGKGSPISGATQFRSL